MSFELRHECGLFGVVGHPEASRLTYHGLKWLQHRGQESAGIAAVNNGAINVRAEMGLVHEVFNAGSLAELPGETAIGHVRYSTTGASCQKNAQPLVLPTKFGPVAIALNGNIVNAPELKEELSAAGAIFATTTDTEILVHLIHRSCQRKFADALVEALQQLEGAYCFLLLTQEALWAIRDPAGYRPLALAQLGLCEVLASESVAFHHPQIRAKYEREVAPGEILKIARAGQESLFPFPKQPVRECSFEHIYFARPNYGVFSQGAAKTRMAIGGRLWEEAPVEGGVIVPVPDSGIFAAMGYAQAGNLPLAFGLTRDHFTGRTFISPKQVSREQGVDQKLCAVPEIVAGQEVVLIDDSIVRGTTSRKIVGIVRAAGASRVHLRISSPPFCSPCFFGVDTPRREELIAANNGVEQIRDYVGADTLAYLSLAGLENVLTNQAGGEHRHCTSCFSGQYFTAAALIEERMK
ncbi:MAG: amidophosphoribosyltransferase [Candidatus Doudnabacteria bacterium]|nr:amidophosphoribosyltransferase [Candidatus Doudnabacteria bacterium]